MNTAGKLAVLVLVAVFAISGNAARPVSVAKKAHLARIQ